MSINPDQAGKIVDAFTRALDKFYGSSVATLKDFQNSRRKTYMGKLELTLDAPKWRKKVADAIGVLGDARGRVTRMENEKQAKVNEMKAQHDLQLAQLREKQAKEVNELVVHYETPIMEARNNREALEKAVEEARREAYFVGIGAEDDGRRIYNSSELGIDTAIKETVDRFMEENLSEDEEGQKVLVRIQQTELVKGLVYFEKSVETMRATFLDFISQGFLPPVTIMAWKIVDGKDITTK